MKYMLDTNIVIFVIRNKPVSVLARLQKISVEDVCISSITLAELEHGVENSSNPGKNRLALTQFLAPLDILPFGEDAASAYGRIRTELERQGKPIGPLDTLIAAQAVALGLVLVTNNIREFRRVKGLHTEDWC